MGWYEKLNQNSKWKKGLYSDENMDKVMYSCLLMDVMMVNKCCKFQSNICNSSEKKRIGTKNLTKSICQFMYSCLLMEIMMVNKCCKFQTNKCIFYVKGLFLCRQNNVYRNKQNS